MSSAKSHARAAGAKAAAGRRTRVIPADAPPDTPGLRTHEALRRDRDPVTGAPLGYDPAPVKPADERQTVADHLDALVAELGAQGWLRESDNDNTVVRLVLVFEDGNNVGATGATTPEAAAKLVRRARKLRAVLAEED